MQKHKTVQASRWILPLAVLLLTACSGAPQAPSGAAKPAAAVQGGKQPAQQAGQQEVLPNLELSSEMLYQFLMGEVALQRGRADLSVEIYLELARSTRDPRVARRAAQIAYESKQADQTIEAFKVWLELEPGSQPARQMLISILLGMGKLDEARPWLAQFLAAEPQNIEAIFRQLPTLLARSPDKLAALKLMRDLAQPYPDVGGAHLAVARMAAGANQQEEALAEVRRARTLHPEWVDAALYEAQLLQPAQPQQALALLRDFLASYPDAEEVRMFYGRLLLERKQYPEAYAEFKKLLTAHPDNAELAFGVAMLSLQMGELNRAEKEMQQSLAHGKKDQDTVHYYLGQLSEAKKDMQAALKHYNKVRNGEFAFPARLREAYLTAAAGKLQDAREMLRHVRAQNTQQQVQLLMLEGGMLRDVQEYDASYQVLRQGLEKFPDNAELLYSAAIMADRAGKPEEMERLLRKLIGLQPENANAYNALGYSLLERNVRLDEGMQLVEKAYKLEPNDPAIQDSMGWGHYRMGRLDKSLEYLRRAYGANPDPEIAAHLGEVLWARGEKEDAKKVWSGALKRNPQNEALQAVMKKFLQ